MTINWKKDLHDRTPYPTDVVEVVERRCRVCEWEGQLVLKEGEDPDCPWCHAPTEPAQASPSPDAPARGKNPHAAALGRLGGLKGGQARARALTAAQRHRIASRAARARWGKTTDKNQKNEPNGKNAKEKKRKS
jgi:hypothetical protein